MLECVSNHVGSGRTTSEQPTVASGSSPAVPWRILLVDDDEWTRQMLRDILESYPDIKVVGEASDGREAVMMATMHRPDLVIMDIALPHVNGIDATRNIKKALPHTLVIGMSGNYTPQVYSAMRTAGAVSFMCKEQVLAIHDTIINALSMWGRDETCS
jgi:DNA-binding NarL/FixJ family response regulator